MNSVHQFYIGNRIGFQLVLNRKPKFIERAYNCAYEYYKCPNLPIEPELTLALGDFNPQIPSGAKTVNKEFIVAPGYIYWKGHKGRGKIEIIGLESPKTIINHFPYREYCLRKLVPGLRAISMYVEPLLKYHLASFDQTYLVHGGAVSRDGHAIVFLGSNGTYKTRLILELCHKHGFKFLGDDLILLKGDHVYSFIEHERVLKARYSQLRRKKKYSDSRFSLLKEFIQTSSLSEVGLKIDQKARWAMSFVLDRKSREVQTASFGKDAFSRINQKLLRQRLNAIERMELIKHQARHRQLINFSRLLMAYEFGVPGSQIFSDLLINDRTFGLDIEYLPSYQAILPSRFSDDIATTVNRLITQELENFNSK